ncbi:MAG: sigma factor-like helix-turn-helix DNA-binding protein [Lachnospiraceae bacterium]|nr:sigma factor-like helix-turn-helix DNA-binding protein [Lachnospiraceae bacterium]
MDDGQIIDLYWARSEAAISETANKYSKYYEQYAAEKRGSGQVPLAHDELQDCIPAAGSVEQAIEDAALVEIFNRFLATLPMETRKVFMRWYWYLSPIKEIAEDYSFSESKVKMTLLRARNELKQILEKEGITL